MAFFIKPEINKYITSLAQEDLSKRDVPAGSIVIDMTENGVHNFSPDQDAADALQHYTDWKGYYQESWRVLDHSASTQDQIKFISEQLFDESLFMIKPYTAVAGRLNQRMACWSALLTTIPLMMDSIYKLMEEDHVSFEQVSGDLELLPPETKASLDQIFMTAITFIFSNLILIGTKEDITEIFYFILQGEPLEIYGSFEESGSNKHVNKDASNLYSLLFASYFAEYSRNVISSENTSENYIIKVTWQDTIKDFVTSLQ